MKFYVVQLIIENKALPSKTLKKELELHNQQQLVTIV